MFSGIESGFSVLFNENLFVCSHCDCAAGNPILSNLVGWVADLYSNKVGSKSGFGLDINI